MLIFLAYLRMHRIFINETAILSLQFILGGFESQGSLFNVDISNDQLSFSNNHNSKSITKKRKYQDFKKQSFEDEDQIPMN